MSVPVKIYRSVIYQEGQTPSNPNVTGDPVINPINPDGGPADELVPYDGALRDVTLGEFGLSTGFIKLDTTPTSTPTDQGVMYWDEDDNTVDIILNGYIMKIGEDLFYPVKNQTGSSIPKGTNVGFAGTLGSSGRLLITPYLADGTFATSRYMGVTAETIADGEDGKVLWFGRIRGINTNAFNEGDILYASTTSAGAFQTTLPVAPNNIVEVAAVVTKSINQGVIFVRPQFLANPRKIDWLTRTINNTSGDINALPTPTDYIEITAADAINGIVPTSSGWVRIVNRKASSLLLRSNNTNASVANRLNIKFQFLTAGDGITLFYDRNTEKWIADDLYSNDIWEQFNISSNTNNLGKNPATNRIRIGGSGAIELTGVANCQNGQLITIFNSKTSENITIKNDSASSTDVNRFDIGADIILEPNRFLPFVHENGRLRRILDISGVPEAPNDGKSYVRKNQAWSSIDIYGDNFLLDDSDVATVITPTQNTEYTYNLGTIDLSSPVGTTYEVVFNFEVVYQNCTSANNFKVILDSGSRYIDMTLPSVPNTRFVGNAYRAIMTFSRISTRWQTVYEIIGKSSSTNESYYKQQVLSITTYTGVEDVIVGLKTPDLAVTSGDFIRINQAYKRRIK